MDIISYALRKKGMISAVSDYLDEHLTNPTDPPIDTSLSIAGAAADAKKTGDEISALKEDLSKLPAEIKGGSVAMAEQLDSNNRLIDQTPYIKRSTPTGAGNRIWLDKIVGASVSWNQLANVTDGKYVSTNAEPTLNTIKLYFRLQNQSTPYIYHETISSAKAVQTIVESTFTGLGEILHNGAQIQQKYAKNMNIVEGHKYLINLHFTSVDINTVGGVVVEDIMCIDLTLLLDFTIADHLYSLEQATTGAGVALFKQMFPEDYYAYDAGSIQSVTGLSAHKMRNADNDVIAEYALDPDETYRGVLKLVDNKIVADGDVKTPDGKIVRNYDIVNLGSIAWDYNGTRFSCTVSGIANSEGMSREKGICSKYARFDGSVTNAPDKSVIFGVVTDTTIYIKDSNYTDIPTFKTAMDDVYLVYKKATPTIEDSTPYQHLQICDPDGTEEFVSTGIAPVGHYSAYPENQVAKLDGLPKDFSTLIAPTEKTNTATRNYTAGSLLIIDNVLYKVTANIANGGTITVGTNVTATTLAEVIAALS